MGVFVTLNLLGIRLLSRANSAITVFKLAIPSLTALALIVAGFHLHNFTAAGGFFVHGGAGPTQSILSAITAGGIAFALMGFEGALRGRRREHPPPAGPPPSRVRGISRLHGHLHRRPGRLHRRPPARPCCRITPAGQGWRQTHSSPGRPSSSSPAWSAWSGWPGSCASTPWSRPSGTGLLYLTGASRLELRAERDGYVPKLFLVEDERTDVPLWGTIMSGALGLLFLLPFPSWGKLVSVVTGAVVLMYAAAPLALGSLRRSRPEMDRPYRLPAAGVLAPASFVFATFIAYWSGWQTISTLMIALLLGYGLMGLARSLHLDLDPPRIEWRSARWLFPYLVGLSVVSYLGDFGSGGILGGVGPFKHVLVGGRGVIPLWWDMACLAVLSLVVYAGAMAQTAKAVSRAHVGYQVRHRNR